VGIDDDSGTGETAMENGPFGHFPTIGRLSFERDAR
jgi:hypothetical protein